MRISGLIKKKTRPCGGNSTHKLYLGWECFDKLRCKSLRAGDLSVAAGMKPPLRRERGHRKF